MLAFDLHGVVMYLLPAMQRYFRESVGFELVHGNRFSFEHPDWYNPSRFGPDIAQSIIKYAKDCKPMYGAIPALKQWRNQGNKIVFVTATAKSTMGANTKWLDKWLGQPYEIHRVVGHDMKVKKLVDLGCTHYVDDRFRTCNLLADHLKHVYLFDDVHNRGRETKANVTRVRSLRKVFNHYSK